MCVRLRVCVCEMKLIDIVKVCPQMPGYNDPWLCIDRYTHTHSHAQMAQMDDGVRVGRENG